MASGDTIIDFIESTGADFDVAQRYLEEYGYSLELSVSAYFDSNGAPHPKAKQTLGASRPLNGKHVPGGKIGGKAATSNSDSSQKNSAGVKSAPLASSTTSFRGGGASSVWDGADSHSVDMTDEYGIRAPDAAHTERLVSAGSAAVPRASAPVATFSSRDIGKERSTRAGGDKGRKAAGLMLMGPPEALLAAGILGDVLERAKAEHRWLLVNIQKRDDFACLELNRSVWRDEHVEGVVKASFLLWQADLLVEVSVSAGERVARVNPHAADFLQAYRIHPGSSVNDMRVDSTGMPGIPMTTARFTDPLLPGVMETDRYPIVALIDPRTREMVWLHRGPISGPAMLVRLQTWLQDLEWGEVVRPVTRVVTRGTGQALPSGGEDYAKPSRCDDISKACGALWSCGGGAAGGKSSAQEVVVEGGGKGWAQPLLPAKPPTHRGIFASGFVAPDARLSVGAGSKRGRGQDGDSAGVITLDSDEEDGAGIVGTGGDSRPAKLQRGKSGGKVVPIALSPSPALVDDDDEDEVYDFEYESDDGMEGGAGGSGSGSGSIPAKVGTKLGAGSKRSADVAGLSSLEPVPKRSGKALPAGRVHVHVEVDRGVADESDASVIDVTGAHQRAGGGAASTVGSQPETKKQCVTGERPVPASASTLSFGPMVSQDAIAQLRSTSLTASLERAVSTLRIGSLPSSRMQGQAVREGAVVGMGTGHTLACPLPPEPDPLTAVPAGSVVRVQIRLPDGRRIVRRARITDPVAALYIIAAHAMNAPHSIASAYDVHLWGYCDRGSSASSSADEGMGVGALAAFVPLQQGHGASLGAGDKWDLAEPSPPTSGSPSVLSTRAYCSIGEAGLASTLITVLPVDKAVPVT